MSRTEPPTPPTPSEPEKVQKLTLARILTPPMDAFGLTRGAALTAFILSIVVVTAAIYWFFQSAPPKTITIAAGAVGSSFETNAEKYRVILARNGVTMKILPSQGSLENLQHLKDESFPVDVGFVQGGVTNPPGKIKLVSLGSISYEPLFIFYRGNEISLLSQFEGKRVAIGAVGSGTRALALTLLQLNGIQPGGATTLSDLDSGDAVKALLDGKVDAVFLMGDSAPTDQIRLMLKSPGIQLFDFTQADGYTRRISYLNKLLLPEGSIDFGKNIPAHDVHLIGPTVELLARPELHPALSDLLLEAAQEVHGNASLLKRRGEFPAPLELDYPISADATRFYKTGKSFLYRSLPYWLASMVRRILLAFVPAIVILIPGLRLLPAVYRLRIRLRIYRWYRALIALERGALASTPEKRADSLTRLDNIEKELNRMKVPASFADQFYSLRGHIDFVRTRLTDGVQPVAGAPEFLS